MSKRQSKALQELEKMYRKLSADLTVLSEQAMNSVDAVPSPRLWERSRCPKQLDSLLKLLLDAERNYENRQDLSLCLKQALEIGVFDFLVSFAIQDKPAGLLPATLCFYSSLIKGIEKDCLLPTSSFHRPISALLMSISEHLKQGVQFSGIDQEIIDFMHTICMRVHRLPVLMEILLVREKGKADEYVLIPILLHYFKQMKDAGDEKMQELMTLCVQVDNREVLKRLILYTDFALALVCKLVQLFKAIRPLEIRGKSTVASPALLSFLRYCAFLNEICEKCLWQDLLSTLSSQLTYYFLERELFPQLTSSVSATAIYTLAKLVETVTSAVILVPVGEFVAGKRKRVEPTAPESPTRPKIHATHSRQFPSFENMMMSAGHQKNTSSASTTETPTKTAQFGEISLNYRENSKINLPLSSPDLESVWSLFLSGLQAPDCADLRFASLSLLKSLMSKGNIELLRILIVSHMRNLPKQAKINVTRSNFLKNFTDSTRERVQKWMEIKSNYKAIVEFCNADDSLATEWFEIDTGETEERSVISEQLASLADDSLSSDSDQSPSHRKHERSDTTIYHEENSEFAAEQPFAPGVVVGRLISSLQNLLEGDLEEWKITTGILDEFCRYAYIDRNAHFLFSYLLDKHPEFPCCSPTLLQVLRRLEETINWRAAQSPHFSSLYSFTAAAESAARKPVRHMSVFAVIPTSPRSVRPTESRSIGGETTETDFVRRVKTFDRFLAKLCNRIAAMEVVRVVKESGMEGWVYSMRQLDA